MKFPFWCKFLKAVIYSIHMKVFQLVSCVQSAFVSEVEDVRLKMCKTEVCPRFLASSLLEDTGICCVYKYFFLKIIFYYTSSAIYRACTAYNANTAILHYLTTAILHYLKRCTLNIRFCLLHMHGYAHIWICYLFCICFQWMLEPRAWSSRHND